MYTKLKVECIHFFFVKFSNAQVRFGKQMKCTIWMRWMEHILYASIDILYSHIRYKIVSELTNDRAIQQQHNNNDSDEAKSNLIGRLANYFVLFSFLRKNWFWDSFWWWSWLRCNHAAWHIQFHFCYASGFFRMSIIVQVTVFCDDMCQSNTHNGINATKFYEND